MTALVLDDVWKIYNGNVEAVRHASFNASDREFIALLGPSGCGKSSTMRMIAGLEDVSRGEIRFGNQVVNDLTPAQRNVAMAFESYALYSPLTVRENLEFPLVARDVPGIDIDRRLNEIVDAFQIKDLLERKPSELSGGQAQRVSLARALIRDPDILLLDEPLSHLDYRLRSQLRIRIRNIHDAMSATTIYVTHDQEEAVTLADRIIVMNHAEIQQIGDVDSLWKTPVNTFVAGFLGDPPMNFIDLNFDDGRAVTPAGEIPKLVRSTKLGSHDISLGFRPEDTMLVAAGEHSGLVGKVSVNEFHGERSVLTIDTKSGQFKTVDGGSSPWRPGDNVSLVLNPETAHFFDRKSGIALQHGCG